MGEVFGGRYELVDVIGEGGMGAVWRAWDHQDERYLAVKVHRQSDAASLLRFVREQATRLHHPNVVTPLGWSGEDSRVLFTMPLVAGGSVATLIADNGPLPPQYVQALLDQLLDALAAVHAARLVHRDVKPANMLLEPTGTGRPHLLLTDFGIAAALDQPRLTRAGHVLATPGYAAPEQQAGADPDVRQDLFAVGVAGRAMLTGLEPPFAATAPDDVPTSLWEALGTLSAPSPDARPVSAAEARRLVHESAAAWDGGWVQQDLEPPEVFHQLPPLPDGFGPDGPLATAPSSPGRRRGRRRTGTVAALGLGGLAAVTAGLLLWGPGGGDSPEPPPASTSGPTTSAPTTSAPTTSAPATSGPVAGAPCDFVDVGVREQGRDGQTLVCTRTGGGSYVWSVESR